MSYKILSLDGGGSWAFIQARVLKDIYGDIKGHELLREFDLVIANSGGSIVLGCLCNNMQLSEIIKLFKEKKSRTMLFSSLTFWEKLTPRNFLSFVRKRIKIGPKYNTDRKLKGLIEALRNNEDPLKKLDDPTLIANTPLHKLPALIGKESLQIIIVGFDYFRERASFFRSNPDSLTDKFSGGKYYQVPLAQAMHASSNAPVNYFDNPAMISSKLVSDEITDNRKAWYWDGAIGGYNNPILAGVIEALTNETGRDLSEFKVLSLGTGMARKATVVHFKYSDNDECQLIYKNNRDNKLVISKESFRFMHDISRMAQSIVSDPPDSASFIAYSILNRSLNNDGNIVRINPRIMPELGEDKKYKVPKIYMKDLNNGEEKFMKLIELDVDAIEVEEMDLVEDLCNKFLADDEDYVPNQLIRGDAAKGDKYLGHIKYIEAKRRWIQISGLDA
jgi:patatin-like phospholipase/acyl hydrolase